jgi:hypothetical protein
MIKKNVLAAVLIGMTLSGWAQKSDNNLNKEVMNTTF